MRALIYAPIVHSEVDLGTMAGIVRERFQRAFGAAEWARRGASVEAMWDGLRTKLLALPLPWARTRVYQDGLPVCAREKEIVDDLAARGSRNHQLLLELTGRGATLMGTEDPALMVRDYRRIQRLAQAARESAPDSEVLELRREGEAILRERDAFIARRIDSTLQERETGIVFLGLLHRANEFLDGKLDVHFLIHNLPFRADPWRTLRDGGADGDGRRHDDGG